MANYDPSVILKYREILKKDPNSHVFALLADAYRDQGDLDLALSVARDGVRRNPEFVSGIVALGRILKMQKNLPEAEQWLRVAVSRSPENHLAHQLLGEICIDTKRPNEALQFFKMVLFLNPHSTRAQKIVNKLESVSSAEYDKDAFEIKKLSELKTPSTLHLVNEDETGVTVKAKDPITQSLTRYLSLLDAYIVRNEILRAKELLTAAIEDLGPSPELEQRQKVLSTRDNFALIEDVQRDNPTALQPLAERSEAIRRAKLEALQKMLSRIESLRP